jgi:tetratricopeptide (TPR) repeat protein
VGAIASALIAGYAGQCAEAAAAEDRGIAAFKVASVNTAYVRVQAADMLLACGRPDAAAAILDKVETDAPGDPVILTANVYRAIALAAAGRSAQADDALGKAAALVTPLMSGPDGREVAFGRGAVSLARKDYGGAIKELEQAQTALPPGGVDYAPTDHVPIWFALGEAYFRAGRTKDAAPWFQRIVDHSLERQSQPFEYVRSLYYLGTIHEQAGDTVGAREAYRRFVGYWKDGTIDRDHIADAQRKLQTLK